MAGADVSEEFAELVHTAALRDGAGAGGFALPPAGAPAVHVQFVDARAIATAAVTPGGMIVAADEHFLHWFGHAAVDARTSARVAARGSIEGRLTLDRDGALAPLAYVGSGPVNGDVADLWCLPEPVRGALRSRRANVAIIGVDAACGDVLHGDIAEAFRLSPAETRLAGALVSRGDLRTAARHLGLAYETARETLAGAMRKVGVRAQTALVARLLDRALGIWRADMPDVDATVAALLGLSRRQVRIALAVSQGASREQAAQQAGVSPAVAKDELARTYATLGIDSATRLARCMTDAMALVALIRGEHGERMPHSPGGEATRFIARPDGSCIACTDHGPAHGVPVLLVHNTGNTRHAARTLVRALQAAGMRPIAIDRPGYGQSDMPLDAANERAAGARADPFSRAADDMALLCETLRLGRVRLLARGSAAVVWAFAQREPQRVERVLMLNPGVPEPFDSHRSAPLAIVKRALYRHPRALEYVTRLLAQPGSSELTARRLRHSLAASPPDLALLDDADELEDYHRATRLMSTGSIRGYIAEHRAYAAGWVPAPIDDARHWTVVCGAHDPLHDAARSLDFWRGRLTGAAMVAWPDAGRFLHVTHAEQVAALLAGHAPTGAEASGILRA